MVGLLFSGILAASTAQAQVAVIPFQRTQALSPDDSLLLQEVVSGLVEESPRFQLVQVSLEDLMAGRVPQFVIAGSLRRTNAGSYELELNLQVKGQTQAVSATVRQGPDLPGLAAALEDVLPSLFGEPAAAKPAAAAATQAPSTTAPERTRSGFFAKPWQPYAAAGGGVLLVIGGGINALAYGDINQLKTEHDALADVPEPTEAQRIDKERLRTEHNNAVERFKSVDLPVSVGLMLSGAALGVLSLLP